MSKLKAILFILLSIPLCLTAQRQMENLDRGVIAISQGSGKVYVGWRMFGTDPGNIAFNLYRSTAGANAVKINNTPITATTDFVNTGVDLTKSNAYFVKPLIEGVEQMPSEVFILPANSTIQQYFSIPIRDGAAVYAQASTGDVDGDGEYEIIFKWSTSANTDPGVRTTVSTATVYIDAYKLNGKFLWRIDLGWNLECGSDYTPMEVYDIDGDGRAEIITKTAEGTIDGTGVKIGDINEDEITDYRRANARVMDGPEFMSIFRGIDGKEIARTNWIERGNESDWGDGGGNRSCRHQMGIAYIDGLRPSIVMSRGVYSYQVVETWNYRDGKLSRVWRWDNGYLGHQGNWHSSAQCFRMADCDGDGCDEIVKGPLVIDHNGSMSWDEGLIDGHGDFTHIGVFDPSKNGLQIFRILEKAQANGVAMLDARTGTILWGKPIADDTNRGYCAHIDPLYKGEQCWAGQINDNLLNFDGTVLATKGPFAYNYFAPIWWDAGLCRSLTDEHSGTDGAHILKWDYTNNSATRFITAGTGTRTIVFIGDILGDWREELVIYQPNEIRVYTTTIPSTNRIYTLMHDPLYKLNVGQWAQRNAAPSHPDFYLGTGMDTPPAPNIALAQLINLAPDAYIKYPVSGSSFYAGTNIDINVYAADLDGSLSKVELYHDTTKLFEFTTPPYIYKWEDAPVGNFNLWVKATDDEGAVSTSPVIHISLKKASQSINIKDDSQISYYPNPVFDKLTIKNKKLSDLKRLVVESINGVMTYSFDLKSASSIEINLSPLDPGMYLVKLYTDKLFFVDKIIKR